MHKILLELVKMQTIFFALVAFLTWGIGDVFGTSATRKIGGYSTTLWFLVLQTIIFGALGIFFINNLTNLTLSLFTLNTVLGFLGAIGLIAFYEALRIGNASLVGTISASFAAVTVILSIIFFKESPTFAQSIAILIVFIGLIVSTLDFKELKGRKLYLNKGVLLSLIPMVTWGIYWTFIKIPVKQIGWFWPGYISSAVSLPAVFAYIYLKKIKIQSINTKNAFLPLVANAVLLGIGALSYNHAVDTNLTTIVAPIAGAYPALFAILAWFAFRDPIKKVEIMGIIITLTGIVLLSAFSI